ncbi:conserved unknown protein [Ectocarpus siliculosus]|uniref:Uncharacterized protein n=1 Tax=Ectocarpus siliculosus TaxID=2880 RepID=D8LFU2_ECTSI|nr:conserved unknown protein [Ectocarpus siliculosus]|eukprot:CBN75666.1 conserved unknown protein [Ectocarpus siliculosus]
MSRFTQELSRYRDRRTFRSLPELTQETVEFELPLDSKGAMMRNGEVLLENGYLAQEPAAARPLVYLAVVDESGGPEYHDVMAEVLDTCVQRLPDDCRLGVVTVSDRVGLVDLAAPLPHVQLVDLGSGTGAGGGGGQGTAGQPGGGGGSWTEPSSAVGLSEVMSLEELLCPIGGNRELISANVRGLRGACRDGGAAAAGRAGTRVTGLAVKLLLNLLLGAAPGPAGAGATSTAGGGRDARDGRVGAPGRKTSTGASAAERGVGGGGFPFPGCRLMLFLGGAPDRGPGALGVVSPNVAGGGKRNVETEGFVHHQLFPGKPRALGFYRGQAYRAASCGVSVDVHCFANKTCGHFGLSSLAPLAMTTGGGVYRHSLLHQREGENRAVTVAREVCAELLQPRVLRRPLASFAMDFEFRGAGGGAELQWDEDEDASATVQSAFAYTAVVPDANASSEAASDNAINGGEATNAARMVTVRRLRVSTVRTDSSPSVEVVATAADPATVAAVLAHKVVSEARRSGFAEARGLLRDWLANFISGLAESLAASEGGRESAIPGGGGVEQAQALMANPLIVGVARQVFGLLQSPVLHPTKGIADERVSLLSRLSSLDPESLSIALYPEMQGYATPDIRLANSLSLSRQAVTEASPACRIFVVDTFWRVVVHYADSPASLAAGEAAGEAPLPFPPSRDSAIGQYLEMRRAVRPLAGQEVVYSRPGTPEAFFFEETLLEDRPLPRAEKAETFKGFFAEIVRDVLQTS